MSEPTEPAESTAEPLHGIRLRVNGLQRSAQAPARRLLSDFLRHDLRLTGTHVGCEHGVCGACTVLVDGRPMRSCLMFAISAQPHEITTIEGIAESDGTLHPMQAMFREHHALQCGFCTPGMVMSAIDLVKMHPEGLTEDQIRHGLEGNLCRCTGYHNIVKAIAAAWPIMHGKELPLAAE